METKWTYKPRAEFKLIGEVLRVNDKSILIRKIGANNQFWIDINKELPIVNEGEKYCFFINVSTYLDRDNKIRNKLRMKEFYPYDGEDSEDIQAFIGIKKGTIESFIETDITSLKIVKFKMEEDGGTYWLRYFSDQTPQIGACILDLDLRSTSKLINAEGVTEDMLRTYVNKDGVEVETRKWAPSLEITNITYPE